MMYQTIAAYYDALVKDEEATAQWVSYVKRHLPNSERTQLLEVACGSGEIALALAQCGYQLCLSTFSIFC